MPSKVAIAGQKAWLRGSPRIFGRDRRHRLRAGAIVVPASFDGCWRATSPS